MPRLGTERTITIFGWKNHLSFVSGRRHARRFGVRQRHRLLLRIDAPPRTSHAQTRVGGGVPRCFFPRLSAQTDSRGRKPVRKNDTRAPTVHGKKETLRGYVYDRSVSIVSRAVGRKTSRLIVENTLGFSVQTVRRARQYYDSDGHVGFRADIGRLVRVRLSNRYAGPCRQTKAYARIRTRACVLRVQVSSGEAR